MKLYPLFIVTSFVLAIGNIANADTEGEPKPDSNRKVCDVPNGVDYGKIVAEVKKQGATLPVQVKRMGIFAARFPDASSFNIFMKIAGALGVVCEQDQLRKISDVMPSSLRAGAGRKLTETIPWGIEKIYERDGIPSSDYYTGLTSKKVCVVDSGYNYDHEDLPNDAECVAGNCGDESICSWHGSHVAGTIGAIGYNDAGVIGVYPGAPDMKIAEVFDRFLFLCLFTYSSGVIGAVEKCRDAGADVVNMSLGGATYSAIEDSAFESFFANDDMLNIASSGNSGPNTINYPSGYSSVISVGATDINDNIADFSTTNDEVDITAPGVDVQSTIGPGSSLDFYSGTSMSCPHVVGATLVLWNKFPGCNNVDVRDALEGGADDLGAPGRDNAYGNGRLNFWNSVDILNDKGCSTFFDCMDSTESYQGKNCAWVGNKPNVRCDICGSIGCVFDICQATCNPACA